MAKAVTVPGASTESRSARPTISNGRHPNGGSSNSMAAGAECTATASQQQIEGTKRDNPKGLEERS
jgi:hypothetical protein